MRPLGETKRHACEVCGKTMRLARTVPVMATGDEFQIWECVACGHTKLLDKKKLQPQPEKS